jgi:hypothetical protein
VNNARDTFGELRGSFDGQDPFMLMGHQILRPRVLRPSDRASEWTSNKEVQKVLLRAFPKLRTDRRQRKRAARWTRIIHLYFRMNMTAGQVAVEMRLKRKTVENLVASIRRVASGRRADNKGMRGQRRPGRPRIDRKMKEAA